MITKQTTGSWISAQLRELNDLLLRMEPKQLEAFSEAYKLPYSALLQGVNAERTRRNIEAEAARYLP